MCIYSRVNNTDAGRVSGLVYKDINRVSAIIMYVYFDIGNDAQKDADFTILFIHHPPTALIYFQQQTFLNIASGKAINKARRAPLEIHIYRSWKQFHQTVSHICTVD